MLNNVSRTWLIAGVWLTALSVVVATSIAMHASLSTSAFLLAAGIAPAVVMALLGGGPSRTVAEVLYSVHTKKDGQ